MLKGLLMSVGLLIYYIIYGKKRLKNKQISILSTSWASLLFSFWLLCTLLFFTTQDIEGINLLWGILLAVSFPVFCVIWKLRVIKTQPLKPSEKTPESTQPVIQETVTFINPPQTLVPPEQYEFLQISNKQKKSQHLNQRK